MKYNILSPDGFPIYPERTYNNKEAAMVAFEEWSERFTNQGYYSYQFQKIPLDELADNCQIIRI